MHEIKAGDNGFYIGENVQEAIAKITFKQKDEQTIIADHTFVSDQLRGQGIAGKLFERLIQHARENNLKIVPECSYVKKKMEGSEAFSDLIATNE